MSANARLQIIIDAKDSTKGAFSGVESSLKGLGTHSKTAGAALGSMVTQVAAVGAVIGGAIVAGVSKAVGVFADFEKGMSAVKAASGATASEMSQLSAAAIALGQDTQLAGIGATDAALAMEELAKGGVSVADQLGGATKGALLLASAGQIEVATAAGIATKAMNIFEMKGHEVAHVADLMSAGANKSATDVEQLGAAFNQSAAVAKNAGLSIEELTGTLAFLAQRGMEGSDAGTSLKTALLALQAPTDKSAELMRDLGINVRDAQGEMLPFADIADILKDRLSGLSAAQRDAALKTIFGNDAIRVGIALYEGGGEAIRDWTAQVDDAGNAARTGAIKNDNLAGSLDQLKAVFETAAIQVGAKFAPAVRKAADELGKFVTKAMASPEVTKALEDLGNRGAAALTALLAKVSDPAFQSELKKWATAALDVGRAIASLASNVADVLGPPLKAAVGWFSDLDEGGKKNVLTFALVAGAAIKFRSELGTLLSVGNSVIEMFARKAAAKATLTAANEKLAGSAGGTAAKFLAVRAAAAVATVAILDLAAAVAIAAGGAIVVATGFGKLADKMDESGQRARDNTQAWDAASIAIAQGANETNNAVDGFTRFVVMQGKTGAGLDVLTGLWNEYLIAQQRAGNATEGLTQAFLGTLGPMREFSPALQAAGYELGNAGNKGAGFNNTLVGLAVGARAVASAVPGMGSALSGAAIALAATGTAATGLGHGLGAAASAIGAVTTAATSATPKIAGAGLAFGAFATAIAGAQGVVSGYDRELQALGGTAGHLGGYLGILQAEWDELNVATEDGKNVTAAQAARYAELAPLIQYLNAQIGINEDRTVAAAEAGVKALQALDGVNAAASAGAAQQGDYAKSLTNSAATTHAAADAAIIAGIKYDEFGRAVGDVPPVAVVDTSAAQTAATLAGIKYDEFGQAVGAVPPVVPVDTSAAQMAATIASIKYDEFGQAIGEVPKSVSVDTSAAQVAAIAAAMQMAKLRVAVATVPTSINITANVDISGALNQIQQLRNNMPSSPAKEGPFRRLPDFGVVLDSFGPAVSRAIDQLPRLHTAIDSETADLQKKVADAASAVAKSITDTLGAMAALSGFDFAKNTPTGAQLSGFAAFVANTTAMIAEIGAQFSEKALEAASKFSDAASKVVGLIGNAVTALTALTDFVPPANAAIYAFGKSLRSLINDISLLAEQVTQEAVDQAAAFAEGAGKVVAILGNGVAGFTALIDFVAPAAAAIYAFGKTLRLVINDFALLAEQITQEATDQAAKFATGAGAVVGMIGNGVAGFTALADFVAPAASAIYAFGKTLRAVINDLALVAEQVTQEAGDAAALFATSAGSVVGIIGAAVEGLTKLLTFVAPSEEAINNFVYAIAATVRKIAEMASQMSTEGIELAGQFGDAAGSVFSALKDALSVFTDLHKLVVPSAQAIDNFGIAVAYTVRRLGAFAGELGKDGIEAAREFGTSVGAIFGSLKSAMDVLTNLEKFKDVAEKAFTSLSAGLVTAIELAQGMVNQSKDLVLQAEEYANNMKKAAALFASGQALGGIGGEEIGRTLGESVISGAREAVGANSPAEELAKLGRDITAGLVQGMDDTMQDAVKKAADLASAVAKAITDTLSASQALGKLDVATLPTGGQTTGILAFTRALVAEMAAASTMLDEDATKATSLFADAAGKVASAVNAGIAALTSLVSFVAPASRAVFDFGKSLRTAVMDLAALADEIGVALAEKAALFSEQATKAIAVFGAGVAGFTGLIGYVRPASKAIYDFGKDLMLAIADLAAIVDEIGQELADKAGKFGEITAKSVAVIGTGAEAFKKLADYTRVTEGAIFAFGKDLMMLIADFAAIVDLIGVEVAKKAGDFADGAGKAVTVVGTALGSFAGLATFVTPGKAAVDGLLATVRYIVARFGEMAQTMSTEGTKQLGDFGAATNAVLGGVKAAIDTFIALDKAVVPQTGDLSDLVVAVQGVTRNMAAAGKMLGDEAIEDATAFGTAAQGIFSALKSGLDLFILIDKPGSWPTTDWLQPLVELMAGVLLRGGQLLTQSQQLKAIADQFSANLMQAGATFASGLGGGGLTLTGGVGGSGLIGGGGTTVINNYYVSGNTLLSKDTATQQLVTGVVTSTQGRQIGYGTSG